MLADDPALTARHPDGTPREHQPVRVVVGQRDVPRGYALAAPDVLHLRTHTPDDVLAALHARGLVDVLLEGGPRLAGAFVAAHRVDRVLAYLAPALLGAGPAALGDAGVVSMDGIERLHVDEVRCVGTDVVVDARPVAAGTADAATVSAITTRPARPRAAARPALRGGTS
jgi:diaminohydroxyphosphoribosylaminopyrimidine deaminase/5-amino-6-(5-phosphoribosylamino)uracil reductase